MSRPKTLLAVAVMLTALLTVGGAYALAQTATGPSTSGDSGSPAQVPEVSIPGLIEAAGVMASGPAPQYLEQAAAEGNHGAQVAKYMWEHGAKVIPLNDGRYAIPMPDRVPPGIDWPRQDFPAGARASREVAAEMVPPLFLDPAELDVWAEAMGSGEAFLLELGDDRYVHVVKAVTE